MAEWQAFALHEKMKQQIEAHSKFQFVPIQSQETFWYLGWMGFCVSVFEDRSLLVAIIVNFQVSRLSSLPVDYQFAT